MRNKILFGIAFTVLLLATLGFKGCAKEEGLFTGTYSTKYKVTTPKGVRVASGRSINPQIPIEVDKGLDRLFLIAASHGFTQKMAHANYDVWLLPTSPKCENPSFLQEFNGGPEAYDGSEWDKDPRPGKVRLCAAGAFILNGHPPSAPGMLVADNVGQMSTIVRYEAEHAVLFFNDLDRYHQTAIHGSSTGHPILGDEPKQSKGNTSRAEPPGKPPAAIHFTLPSDQTICLLVTD